MAEAELDAPGADGEDEERERYRELLEELRTILPGVQVLFAFLLTAPFSQRFTELDAFGRNLYGVALGGAALAAIVFLSPASYHRVAPRRARSERIQQAIRTTVLGMAVLAVSMLSAIAAVVRFVYGPGTGKLVAAGLGGVVLVLWYVIPTIRRVRGG